MSLRLPTIGTKIFISQNQTTDQIISLLCRAVHDSKAYYPALKKRFDTGNDLDTLEDIFDYAKENFAFIPEPPENQNVKTVGRVLENRSNDCKGYSSFIINSCLACGIPAQYRLASYNKYDKTVKHVYVTAIVDGERYILDATPGHRFNEESAYTHYFDLNPNKKKMALHYLQGAPQAIGDKAKRDARKAKRQENRKAKENMTKEEKKTNRRQKVAKVAAAPSRAAFLVIVRLNGFKLATKLAAAYRKNQQGVMNFWAKVGGNWEDLRAAIQKGSKETLGEPVTITAALATAAPILAAVKALIKQLGLFQGNEEAELDDATDEGIEILDEDPTVKKSIVVAKGGATVFQMKAKGTPPKTRDVQLEETPSEDVNADPPVEGSFDMKKLIIPAAAAAALYFMTTKK